MTCASIGARSALHFNEEKLESVPSSTSLTYEGIINENLFPLNSLENKQINNIEISSAIFKNPITNKKEAWLGLLMKSKYDGKGIREPIDLAIALDVSGSMNVGISLEHESKPRIELAINALNKLFDKLEPNDNVGFSTLIFNCVR